MLSPSIKNSIKIIINKYKIESRTPFDTLWLIAGLYVAGSRWCNRRRRPLVFINSKCYENVQCVTCCGTHWWVSVPFLVSERRCLHGSEASVLLTPSLPGPSAFQDPGILVSIDRSRWKFPSYMDRYIDECWRKFLSRVWKWRGE